MTAPLPPLWVWDVECYSNYFLLMVRNVLAPGNPAFVVYERFNDRVLVDAGLPSGTLIGFNSNSYDLPLVSLARAGASNATLKRASDDAILREQKPWDLERTHGFERIEVDHIDLIEVAPGQASLKIYGGRMHSRRMQDLPIAPDAVIADHERATLQHYCGNDLLTTIDLYRKLKPQLDLRAQMSSEYGIDLRSKSDAQIAEAVIRSEVEKLLGRRVYRPEIGRGYTFRYRMPEFVAFASPGLNQVLDIIRGIEFRLEDDGSVVKPHELDGMRVRIGNGLYTLGIGGLHSNEKSRRVVADDEYAVIDRDTTSNYPMIILTQGLYPPQMGTQFLTVYRSIVERRIAAKKAGDTVTADALKIVVNGSFGKLGSKWSALYSPDLMVAVTLTGQLALLMLIESLEAAGFEVVSANTDGVMTRVARARRHEFEMIVAAWELQTGLGTEEVEYLSVHSKDVNNYIAVTREGKVKRKGLYAPEGLQKNSTGGICVDAAVAHVTQGVPLMTTIGQCTDIRKFVTIRTVKGGAKYGDQYLGKAVRWYYAKGERRHIEYASNGNKVARSEGARPIMELPDTLPHDIDLGWYAIEAQSILHDIGL